MNIRLIKRKNAPLTKTKKKKFMQLKNQTKKQKKNRMI